MRVEKPLIELQNIYKSFPGVEAVKNVSLKVNAGEVRALIGENGAGKSVTAKMIAGIHEPDKGTILVGGKAVSLHSPAEAYDLGISLIHQELKLVPNINVAKNLLLGRLPSKYAGMIDSKKLYSDAKKVLKSVHLNDLNPDELVGTLSVAQQQLIEIAKHVSRESIIMIMDEPTAALPIEDVKTLFTIIRRLKEEGLAIIYISHRLEEIFEVADSVTVLRNGVLIDTCDVKSISKDRMIKMMVNRDLKTFYTKKSVQIKEEILKVEDLATDHVSDVSFTVRKGEIVGIAGLMGSGRTEIIRGLFGVDEVKGGTINLLGSEIKNRNPLDAINREMAWVTEDRKQQGLVLSMSVAQNVTLPSTHKCGRFGLISSKQQQAFTNNFVDKLKIKTPSLKQLVVNLSGGNQQKVIVGKWLGTTPSLLVLDEPTRGIDIGAKAEMFKIIGDLVEQGLGIILISSEMPELLALCDRIVVMSKGEVTGRFNREEFDQEAILAAAFEKHLDGNVAAGGSARV